MVEKSPYGIMTRPFSKDIVVGKLSSDRKLFTGKQYVVTDEVLLAVKDYVKAHGDLAATFPDGTRLELRVVNIDD